MTTQWCTFTTTCPLPTSSTRHLPGCPVTGGDTPIPGERLVSDRAMFPEPQMDYAANPEGWRDPGVPEHVPRRAAQMERLHGEREPTWFPPYFVVGFVCGIVTAAVAFLGGLIVSVT